MFAQEHNEYLDSFFAEHPHPGISWIHDLGRGRYALASQALLTEAEHAPELVSKHVSYLCHTILDTFPDVDHLLAHAQRR